MKEKKLSPVLTCAGTARPHGLCCVQHKLGGSWISLWGKIDIFILTLRNAPATQLFSGCKSGKPHLGLPPPPGSVSRCSRDFLFSPRPDQLLVPPYTNPETPPPHHPPPGLTSATLPVPVAIGPGCIRSRPAHIYNTLVWCRNGSASSQRG